MVTYVAQRNGAERSFWLIAEREFDGERSASSWEQWIRRSKGPAG